MLYIKKLKINNDNSYAFPLNMMTPGKNIRENRISLFNMNPNSEYIVHPANNEQERKKDTYQLELFINNKYMGLYFLGQNIKINQ